LFLKTDIMRNCPRKVFSFLFVYLLKLCLLLALLAAVAHETDKMRIFYYES